MSLQDKLNKLKLCEFVDSSNYLPSIGGVPDLLKNRVLEYGVKVEQADTNFIAIYDYIEAYLYKETIKVRLKGILVNKTKSLVTLVMEENLASKKSIKINIKDYGETWFITQANLDLLLINTTKGYRQTKLRNKYAGAVKSTGNYGI